MKNTEGYNKQGGERDIINRVVRWVVLDRKVREGLGLESKG